MSGLVGRKKGVVAVGLDFFAGGSSISFDRVFVFFDLQSRVYRFY